MHRTYFPIDQVRFGLHLMVPKSHYRANRGYGKSSISILGQTDYSTFLTLYGIYHIVRLTKNAFLMIVLSIFCEHFVYTKTQNINVMN